MFARGSIRKVRRAPRTHRLRGLPKFYLPLAERRGARLQNVSHAFKSHREVHFVETCIAGGTGIRTALKTRRLRT